MSQHHARRQLAAWGVTQPVWVRFQWLTATTTMLALVSAGSIVALELYKSTNNPSAFALLAAAVAAGAVIIGYQQWKLVRYEISFDKFYERINLMNSYLAQWPDARALMSDDDGAGTFSGGVSAQQKMYAFFELDTLEYAIEKYRLGLLHADLALRAARTFWQRCRWQKFRLLVNDMLEGRSDYSAETIEAVRKISSERENLGGAMSILEHPGPSVQGGR